MTYFAIYLPYKNMGIGKKDFPLAISKNKQFLENIIKNRSGCFISEINSLPQIEYANGEWQILEENTFAFNNENPYNLKIISHEKLSELLAQQ